LFTIEPIGGGSAPTRAPHVELTPRNETAPVTTAPFQPHAHVRETIGNGRAWIIAGIVGGVAGLAALVVSSTLGQVDDTLNQDTTKVVHAIADKGAIVWISQVLFIVAMTALIALTAAVPQ
jgi:hypothetical protein